MEDSINILSPVESPYSKIVPKKGFVRKLINICKRKANTKVDTHLAEKIAVDLRTWRRFCEGHSLTWLTFYRIGKFCNQSFKKMTDGVKSIDNILNPNIPLRFDTKEGVRLDVAVINEGRTRSRIVEYTNKDEDVLKIIRKSAKRVLGKSFIAPERKDERDNTVCLSFPPYFAKHFVKLGIKENKNKSILRVPQYVLDKEQFHKIWWQGNMSEEASIYPFVIRYSRKLCSIFPRIQLHRVTAVNFVSNSWIPKKTYYQKDILLDQLSQLKKNIPQLIKDEVSLLANFGIFTKPRFSKLYVNKNGQLTATYSINIQKISDLETFTSDIGFELDRHRKQLVHLLNNRANHSLAQTREILIKFYKMVPVYLRGIKKIEENKWLEPADKRELLKNVEANNCDAYGSRRSR